MSSIYNKANIVGGSFQDSQGSCLSLGWLVFVLSHDSNVSLLGSLSGVQVLSGLATKMCLDMNGNLLPNQYLWTNDVLNPAGSYYSVTAYNSSGLQVWGSPQKWNLQYAPVINAGYLIPNTP